MEQRTSRIYRSHLDIKSDNKDLIPRNNNKAGSRNYVLVSFGLRLSFRRLNKASVGKTSVTLLSRICM